MLIEPMRIPEIRRIVPKRFADDRGYFVEIYNKSLMEKAGIDFQPTQENQSFSHTAGTVRGLHYQAPPATQAKLVRVLKGRILDVAVDLREGSPTYKSWVAAEISADDGAQLFIPKGFAHGFCTLEFDTEIAYLVDRPYSPEHEGVISWNDPSIAIDWPPFAGSVLSDKDESAPLLQDIRPPLQFGAL